MGMSAPLLRAARRAEGVAGQRQTASRQLPFARTGERGQQRVENYLTLTGFLDRQILPPGQILEQRRFVLVSGM